MHRLLLAIFVLNQQAKKSRIIFGGVIHAENHGEIELLVQNVGQKDYVWSTGDPLGHLLVLPCPVTKVNGKQQQPNTGNMTEGTDSPGMYVRASPPRKEPRLIEVLAKGEEIQLRHVTSYRNEDYN